MVLLCGGCPNIRHAGVLSSAVCASQLVSRVPFRLAGGYEQGGHGQRGDGIDLGDMYGEAGAEGEEEGMVPPGKEPQLWEFARDVVTSLVSDLAVVSEYEQHREQGFL